MTPLIHSFDNRKSNKKGRAHYYWNSSDGTSICYSYIRKNACSAFKLLLQEEVVHCTSWQDASKALQCQSLHQAAASDIRLFVYRDPIERIVSGYINKCIQMSGNADVASSIKRSTGLIVDEISFDQFVNLYLVNVLDSPDSVDAHFHPMQWHLLPMEYNCAVPIEVLEQAMKSILGDSIGSLYFSRPVNRSNQLLKRTDINSGLTGVDSTCRPLDLISRSKCRHQDFHGFDFVSPALRDVLHRLYLDDFNMIEALA